MKQSHPTTFQDLIENPRVQSILQDPWSEDLAIRFAPRIIEIQPTGICARTCFFCSHFSRRRNSSELSEAVVLSLLDELETIQPDRISYSGGGEPLEWQSGDLVTVIKRSKQIAPVHLTTNGDAFWNDETGELSWRARDIFPLCDSILLNVPGVDEESFKQQAIGTTWARVRTIIQNLALWKRTDSIPDTDICCAVVVNQRNFSQLPLIDTTLRNLGVDHIYYKRFKAFENRNFKPLLISDENVIRVLEDNNRNFWSADLNRFWVELSSDHYTVESATPCWMVLLGFSAIIDPNGYVYVSTPSVGQMESAIGNINQMPFSVCWFSDERIRVVQRMSERSSRGLCPLECRFHRYNKMVDMIRSGDFIREDIAIIETPNAGFDVS